MQHFLVLKYKNDYKYNGDFKFFGGGKQEMLLFFSEVFRGKLKLTVKGTK